MENFIIIIGNFLLLKAQNIWSFIDLDLLDKVNKKIKENTRIAI